MKVLQLLTKILIVTKGFYHPWVGGVASFSRGLAESIAFAKKKQPNLNIEVLSSFDSSFVRPNLVETKRYLAKNSIKLKLNNITEKNFGLNELRIIEKLNKDFKFDIIHVVSDGLNPLLVKSRVLSNKKTLLIKHLFIYPVDKTFLAERFFYSYLEKTDFLKSLGIILSPSCVTLQHIYGLKKSTIIPPIIDTDFFKPLKGTNSDAKSNPLNNMQNSNTIVGDLKSVLSHETILLYMGPLTEGRFDPNCILKSVSLLEKQFSVDVGLIAVGRGFEKENHLIKIKGLVEKFELQSRVFFCTKALSDDEKIFLFNKASVFLNIFDSKLIKDSVVLPPMVILEAMATGKPVIVGGLPSLELLIRNHENGVFIKDVNNERLIASEIWHTILGLRRISFNARLTIEKEFSINNFSKTYLNFLQAYGL
jgi:glycosyltransferase involved in cell wall biosynthesis